MKLVVNIGVLRYPMTGVGRYVLNLLQIINQHPDLEDIIGVTLTGFVRRDQLVSILNSLDRSSKPKLDFRHSFFAWAAQKPLARIVQSCWIKLLVYLYRNRYKDYVYWETSGALLPFTGKTISTVYDLSFLALPQYHPPVRVRELSRRLPAYLQKSSRIIAISNYTREQLFQHYSIHIPIDVVKPAVAPEYFDVSTQQKEDVRARLMLPDNYVLAVSTIEPRKNLVRLLKAYNRLPKGLQHRFPLVLVGAKGWLVNDVDTSNVRYLGYVEQSDLPSVVALASLNVYLSLYEGYGMPIAESMATGTPVLCSNITSMPEVANGTCFLVDPTDVGAITQTMKALLESDVLRMSKIDAARKMAATYTWASSANTIIQAIQPSQK